LCAYAPQPVACQTESFDILHYTAPSGWKKTVKDQAVAYSKVNKNGFCVITVYASTESAGSSQKDFASSWNALVVQPYKVEGKPKTETQAAGNGWTGTAAGAEVEDQGNRFYVLLTVFSGFGRATSVLAQLNDQAYVPEIDAFLQSITLDKDAPLSRPPAEPQGSPTSNTSSRIVGKWWTSSQSGYLYRYNIISQKEYTFSSNGTYTFTEVGVSGSFHLKTEETGIYVVTGDSVTISPRQSKTVTNEGVRNNPLEKVTYLWKTHYFAGITETDLVLHPNQKTRRDGEFAFNGLFPNSYIYAPRK